MAMAQHPHHASGPDSAGATVAGGPAAIATTVTILVAAYRNSSANSQVGAEPVTVDTRFLHTLFLLRSGRLLWFGPTTEEGFHDQAHCRLSLRLKLARR